MSGAADGPATGRAHRPARVPGAVRSEPVGEVRLEVVGMAAGAPVVAYELGHGEDPRESLRLRGWAAHEALEVVATSGLISVVFAVGPADGRAVPARGVVRDPGVTEEDVAAAVPYQRAAAYGLVTSERGLLLTELSGLTNAPGRWTLPGGGIDPGEAPVAALAREVWEETGQQVTGVRLVDVISARWLGRAPSGRLEDYHAVRIFYAARCPEPSEPVVHDVGRSTSAAAWFSWSEVVDVDVVSSFGDLVRALAAEHH